MNASIQFLGGAQCVTGSKYLLTIEQAKGQPHRLLVDCGLFQGLKELRLRNWEPLPINASTIETVIITHAHIDHTGYLPKLYRDGFRGRILCTDATRDLMEIMLLDSAKLQEEEAHFANEKAYSKHHPALPLYSVEDVQRVLPLIESHPYETCVRVTNQVEVIFRDAGHILGSAIVEMFLQGERMNKKIVFSGDLGRYDNPVLHDPTAIAEADILLVESTYGDRQNQLDAPEDTLAQLVNAAFERGGCLLIPAFSVGRTQTLLYYLKKLLQAGKIPAVPVYVDSPMAIRVTELYQHHPNDHRLGTETLFEFEGLHFVERPSESKELNLINRDAIIISASGMCTGGRILHHLHHRLPRPNDTLLLVGYQAEGTRGRRIQEGESTIKMFGEQVPVRCHVEKLDGLSAHADQGELLRWLSNFGKAPKRTFIVHGEKQSSERFAHLLPQALGWQATLPTHLESVDLFEGI